MYLRKNEIYKMRFSSKVVHNVMTLEDAQTDEQRIKVLDLDDYEEKHIDAYDVWDEPVNIDELDADDLKCDFKSPFAAPDEQNTFHYILESFLNTDKTLNQVNIHLSKLNEDFFKLLDINLDMMEKEMRLNRYDIYPKYMVDTLAKYRADHKDTTDLIWLRGVLVI